jgi:hypothetical protein
MIQFPYGIADFRRLRRDGMVYVDRTAYIRDLENLGSTLVFLRPRRFGKSLWLQTLATYYDLRFQDDFDELFGGLKIAAEPTPLQGRFFVLQWNFSLIKPRGDAEEIAKELRNHVRDQVEAFVSDYEEHLPAAIRTDGSAQSILISLLSVVRKTPYKLYLLIDEYDNFTNEVMVRDVATYKALFEADGPYKELMKSVKNATEGLGLERVFVTGVSPVALNDLTSGFNTATDVSLRPELAGLCGFQEGELRDLLQDVAQEKGLSAATVEDALKTMRTWYNGYRFTNYPARNLPEGAEDGVYNPINALYFLKHLYDFQEPPETLQDENLRTDQAKLAFLARTSTGAGVVEDLTENEGEIKIPRLVSKFSLRSLTERLTKDRGAIASLLYYMGLLTLTEVRGSLRIPNLVVKKLFLDRLLEIYLPRTEDSYQAHEIAMDFFLDGDLGPLLTFMEEKFLRSLSNEMTLKAFFLSILFDDTRYVLHSELEVERGYVDLCLLVRPEVAWPGAFDLLLELKFVRRKKLGKKGLELRDMDEKKLRALPQVEKAFQDGREEAARYRAALGRRYGEALRLRSYVVVAVGLERLLGEETSP